MLEPQPATSGNGAYEHVLVVMSIVLGLAVTQLLKGAAQLYRARARVRTYWLHWAWTALLVVFSLLLWWTYWNYRSITEWDFLRFVLYLSPVVTFYFLAAIAFPEPTEGVGPSHRVLVRFPQGPRHVGLDEAGRERVDAHARRELLRELTGEMDEGGLGHVVGADERPRSHPAA